MFQLGHEQAKALEPTFNALYALGMLLSRTIRIRDLWGCSTATAHDVDDMFASLVGLVGDIAVHYRHRISTLSHDSVKIDFDKEFQSQIDDIFSTREHLVNHVWEHQLAGVNGLPVDIAGLRSKMEPSQVSAKSIIYGRVAQRRERAEGTCNWIHRDLARFLGSREHIFTITGSPGCGKSVLASWITDHVERRGKCEAISFSFGKFLSERPFWNGH